MNQNDIDTLLDAIRDNGKGCQYSISFNLDGKAIVKVVRPLAQYESDGYRSVVTCLNHRQ